MSREITVAERQSKSSWGKVFRAGIESCALILVLCALVAVFGRLNENFISFSTVVLIANQTPDLIIVSVGMTFVLIVGGIDLSIGSVVALCSVIMGVLLVDHHWHLSVALLAAVATGVVCGVINGGIGVTLRIPSFIVTLGMLEIARGAAYQVSDSSSKYLGASLQWIGARGSLGFSPAFLLAIAIMVIGQIVLTYTLLGRYWLAIGTNEQAVKYSGIDPRPYRFIAFVILGGLCGIAAIARCAQVSIADPNSAIGLELSAIAAAVIGGTSLMGGRGSVWQTFLGVLVISVLQTGLSSADVGDPMKRIITGMVIVLAVVVDVLRNKRAAA